MKIAEGKSVVDKEWRFQQRCWTCMVRHQHHDRTDRRTTNYRKRRQTDRQKKTSLRKKESASKSSIPEYARGRDASVR